MNRKQSSSKLLDMTRWCCILGMWECALCLGKVLGRNNSTDRRSLEPGGFSIGTDKGQQGQGDTLDHEPSDLACST